MTDGCGVGYPKLLMAKAISASSFVGYDFHAQSYAALANYRVQTFQTAPAASGEALKFQAMCAAFLDVRYTAFQLHLRKGWKRNPSGGDSSMATQIVMDQTGDTRHQFDAKDLKAVADAERRFKVLTGNGFTAATRQPNGDVSLIRAFDPSASETVFYPRLVGG